MHQTEANTTVIRGMYYIPNRIVLLDFLVSSGISPCFVVRYCLRRLHKWRCFCEALV